MRAVDYRETLVAYLNSETMEDAARTLNINKSQLSSRMNIPRKAGVAAPKKDRKESKNGR